MIKRENLLAGVYINKKASNARAGKNRGNVFVKCHAGVGRESEVALRGRGSGSRKTHLRGRGSGSPNPSFEVVVAGAHAHVQPHA
jgi:hypothetical protein